MPRSKALRQIARFSWCGVSSPKLCQRPSEIAGSFRPGTAAAVVDHRIVAIVGGVPGHVRFLSAAGGRICQMSGSAAAPGAVMRARFVDALEAVRAEEVALRLDQVRRAAAWR